MTSTSGLSILPKVAKLSARVVRILGCNPGPMTLQGTNTYMVGTGKRRILIDTGDGEQSQYFLNLKKSINFDNVTLDSVILTHWHLDHVGGVEEVLKSSEGAKVYKFPRSADDEPDTTVKVDFIPLENGQTFKVEGATLTAHHTPGHTTDHVILHLKEENAVFSGDCILGEGSTVFEDLHDYMNSLRMILDLNPDLIYPGHGPIIRDPKPKVDEYIAHRNLRESQILDVLRDGRKLTPMEIVKVVYSETPEVLHAAAAMNVSHHLKKLFKEAKVDQAGESYSLRAP